MKPQNFHDCGGLWRFRHLGFFTNHLKLVNSVPERYMTMIENHISGNLNNEPFSESSKKNLRPFKVWLGRLLFIKNTMKNCSTVLEAFSSCKSE